MGTWGVGTFENDGNSDWLYDLEESADLVVVEDGLSPESSGELGATDGEYVLAAAEVILGIKYSPRENLPDNAVEWIDKHKHLDVEELIPKAIELIDQVLADGSELNDLWKENDEDYPKWVKNVKDLQTKLKEQLD